MWYNCDRVWLLYINKDVSIEVAEVCKVNTRTSSCLKSTSLLVVASLEFLFYLFIYLYTKGEVLSTWSKNFSTSTKEQVLHKETDFLDICPTGFINKQCFKGGLWGLQRGLKCSKMSFIKLLIRQTET